MTLTIRSLVFRCAAAAWLAAAMAFAPIACSKVQSQRPAGDPAETQAGSARGRESGASRRRRRCGLPRSAVGKRSEEVAPRRAW